MIQVTIVFPDGRTVWVGTFSPRQIVPSLSVDTGGNLWIEGLTLPILPPYRIKIESLTVQETKS